MKEVIDKIKKYKIVIGIISIVMILGIIGILLMNHKKRECEKNTDVSHAIHAIVINQDAKLYKKPKVSKWKKMKQVEPGNNVYILENLKDEEGTEWYKVKSDDRVGYILKNEVSYFMSSDKEKVLMSDVSKFNIQFEHFSDTEDYELFLLKRGINYVYIRAGGRGYGEEGNFYTDTKFQVFIDACEYLGIPYGFYYIDEAITSEEIDEEIEFVKKFVKEHATSMCKLPIAIDIEGHDGVGRADNVWEDRAELVSELIDKFKTEGMETIVYSNAKIASEYLDTIDTRFWIAYYPNKNTIPKDWYTEMNQEVIANEEFMHKVIAWQFSESGAGNEIPEKVDISLVENSFFR